MALSRILLPEGSGPAPESLTEEAETPEGRQSSPEQPEAARTREAEEIRQAEDGTRELLSRTEPRETAVRRAQSGPAATARPTAGGDSALGELYRRVRTAAQTGDAAARGAGVAVVRETVAPAPGLTAGELDRAMRRDSRRYDGGMTIY